MCNYIISCFLIKVYITRMYLYQVSIIAVFPVFRLLTDFICLLTYEFCLSLWKIARCSVILLLPLFIEYRKTIYLHIFIPCSETSGKGQPWDDEQHDDCRFSMHINHRYEHGVGLVWLVFIVVFNIISVLTCQPYKLYHRTYQ